jgi:hypothetical protein
MKELVCIINIDGAKVVFVTNQQREQQIVAIILSFVLRFIICSYLFIK